MRKLSVSKREAANSIIESLRADPTGWRWKYPDSRLWIRHQTGIILAVYGGAAELEDPAKMKFGWIDWFRIRRAYKRWVRRQGKAQADACDIETCRRVAEALA